MTTSMRCSYYHFQTWLRLLAAQFARGFAGTLPPKIQRAQGRPGARCTRGLVCKAVRKNAHEHTGSAESIRPSLRNGFTAYSALSPATNSFLSPSSADCRPCVKPGRARKTSTDLTSATDARTTRLRRTQPPSSPKRLRRAMAPSSCAKDIAHGINPPCDCLARRRCRVHRTSSQRS
jgi:hypothetical protein